MRKARFIAGLWIVAALVLLGAPHAHGQGAAQSAAGATALPARPAAEAPHQRVPELGWRVDALAQTYASIDGAHLKQFVADQTAMSRKYRDAGHQFWGRIIGTEADTENAQWLMEKFKQLGLSDVHEQYFDLAPQWMPQSWSVTASSSDKALALGTAQPTYTSVGTPAGGLDLEAVYVGSGSEAELNLARDVKGRAAFILSQDLLSRHAGTSSGAIKRAEDRGAAAIFVIVAIPDTNYKTQFYPVGTKVPTFSMGYKDGLAMRDLIGAAAHGGAPHVKINLDLQMVPNLKSGTVWGTLPGTTDETVYVVAHRDGWFEGANDNAAGVATMLGIAEYFSKVPKAQRRRTIVFMGSTGHHNGRALEGGKSTGAESGVWMAQHPEIFAKTALLINCEHTGAADSDWTVGVPAATRSTNGIQPLGWYVGGSPKLVAVATKAFDAMGVPTEVNSDVAPGGEIGRYYWYAPSLQLLGTGWVWHSDHETDDTISATGLAAVTRAEAKIIADIDAVPLKDLRRAATGE
jgi:peptidase M28-like protein